MDIKVSVIVPVSDETCDNRAVLEDINRQTLKEKEIIFVNLGTSEGTGNFFENIHGEFIIFWNQNLSYKKQMLQRLLNEISEQDSPDIVICNGSRKSQFSGREQSADILELADLSLYDMMIKKETAVRTQWIPDLSVQAAAWLIAAFAGKIRILDEKLTEDSTEREQIRKNITADSLFRNASVLHEELKIRDSLQDLERNFTNIIFHRYLHILEEASDRECFIKNFRTDELYELGIAGHTRPYFYDSGDFDALLKILEKTPDELWEKKSLVKTKIPEPTLFDLEDWKPANIIKDVRVTVIIPFYNVEKYLRECLESVVNQTFRSLEILCVDNRSTDKSADIVKEFAEKDSRIRLLSEETPGASAARNKALSCASGKYIYFLDSDDILKQKTLEFCVSMAEEQNLDMVLFSTEEFFENEILYREKNEFSGYYNRYGDYSGLMTGKEFFSRAVSYGEYKPAVFLFFLKREILERENIRFIEGIVCEDNIFTIQCLTAAERVRYVNGKFYRRRLREKSVMTGSSGLKLAYSYYVVLKSLERYIEEKDFDREYSNVLLKQMERMRDNACRAIHDMDFSEIEKEISQDLTAEWIDFYFYIYSVKNIKTLNERHYREMKKSSENEKIMKLKFLYQKNKENRINQELKGELRELKEERQELKEELKAENRKLTQKTEELQKVSKEYQSLKEEHSELNKKHHELHKQHDALNKQHKDLKKRIADLSNSWSYKIGRTITAIPRKARYIIKKYIIKKR